MYVLSFDRLEASVLLDIYPFCVPTLYTLVFSPIMLFLGGPVFLSSQLTLMVFSMSVRPFWYFFNFIFVLILFVFMLHVIIYNTC